MEEKKKNWMKEHKMSIFVVVSAVLMLIGLSYAWLQITLRGNKELTLVAAGTLYLELDDSMAGGITIESAEPVLDDVGKSGDGYTFTLENKGKIASDYTIYLDDLPLTDETRMNDSFIKYQLVRDGNETIDLLNSIGENPNRILDSGTIAAGRKYTYTLKMWIDSSATNEVMGTVFKGKLRIEAMQSLNKVGKVADIVFDEKNIGDKGSVNTSDSEQTFITGEDPNNYIWYSGKLWRAVSKDTTDNSVKLLAQQVQGITYYTDYDGYGASSSYQDSWVKEWLNDTSVDGFLGNLREPEKFIKMDSSWNATTVATRAELSNKLEKVTMTQDAVGLLNGHEYVMISNNTANYLSIGVAWITMTPLDSEKLWILISDVPYIYSTKIGFIADGIRPAINLKPDIEIVSGDGSSTNPYRLKGDVDTPRSGVLLNTRYSGEYVRFGSGENNLYQIVSREHGGVKLVSMEPLKQNGVFLKKKFNTEKGKDLYNPNDATYELAYFLNHDFLDPANGYVTENQVSMIRSAPWYLGSFYFQNYKLGKYTDTTGTTLTSQVVDAKVGLLRVGELLSTQVKPRDQNVYYWFITPVSSTSGYLHYLYDELAIDDGPASSTEELGIKPAVHLKKSVKITGGDGTLENPFTIAE